MADTVESLRAELNQLRTEFNEFKAYAKPVIDGHQVDPKANAMFRSVLSDRRGGSIPK